MKLKLCTALLTAATIFAPLAAVAEKAQNPAEAKRAAVAVYGKLPLSFEPTESSARFVAHSGSYTVAVGARESSVVVAASAPGKGQTLRFAFENANSAARLEALDATPGVTNYYLGQDPGKWRLGVKHYAKLRAQGLYPGVDVIYYGDHRRMEFDFVVAPKADPSVIGLSFSGMEKIYKDANGDLVAEVGGQPVRFAKPSAYQTVAGVSKPVEVSYELAAGRAHLRLGAYDSNSELIIDPLVSYANYLGGSQGDVANGIAVDSSGNAYVTGTTCSSDFPDSSSSIPANCSAWDAFVTKYNTDGTAYVYTTIIGDTNSKYSVSANAIALDSSNRAYITGGTNYPNLTHIGVGYLSDPSIAYLNKLNTWRGGDSDVFITILAADGSLLRTSYLGGSGADTGYGIAVDSSDNVTVVGQTCSQDFPGYNAFETKIEQCVAFLTKLDNNLDIGVPTGYGASALSPLTTATNGTVTYFFSEFYGGQPTAPFTTAIWSTDTAYAAGAIVSDGTNVEVALNAGVSSAVLPSSTTWQWATIKNNTTLDGSIVWQNVGPAKDFLYASTEAYGVALDPLGDVFVVGGTNTESGNLAPYTYYVGSGAWVLKVSGFTSPPPLSKRAGYFVYGTVLETTATDKSALTDAARAVAVDSRGRAYVTGTVSGTLFTTSGAYQTALNKGDDAFLVRINNAGSAIDYATYLGGGGNDQGLGVAVDGSGSAYVTGSTQSADFPAMNALTNPVTQTKLTTLSGTKDAFVTRVAPDGSALTFSTYLAGSDGSDIDQSNAIALNPTNNGDMFVAGSTTSSDFYQLNPLGSTVAQSVYEGNGDAFVAKLTATTPVVSLSASSLAFGNQLVNSASDVITVTVTNAGTVPLNLTNIAITGTNPGDFSQTNTCGQVAAGAQCTISLTFRPTAAGSRSAAVTLTDDAADSPQGVSLSGTGVSGSGTISFSPTSLAFGNQTVNSSVSHPVTLTNSSSSSALTISQITISGNSDFTKDSSACPASLAVGANCTITVTFLPTSAVAKTATLTVTGSASNSPQSVILTGTGTTAPSGSTPFTVTPVATGVSITQGGTAVYSLTVAPLNGYNSPITFTCSGPSGSSCSVSPNPLTMDGTTVSTVKVYINTNGGNGVTASARFGARSIFLALLPFSMMGILLINKRRGYWLALMLVAICLLLGSVGCGAGAESSSSVPLAPGTYQINVVAASGTTTQNIALSLVVNKQ